MTQPFLNSLLFAVMTTVFATVGGMAVFWGAVSASKTRGWGESILVGGAVGCLLMPPFLHAGAWWKVGMGLALPVATIPFGAMVLSLQLWPVVFLVLLAASRRLEPSLLEAARIFLPPRRIWNRIVLPMLLPALCLASAVVFILALNHFIVPTTFQTPVQIADVYVMFSSLYDTRAALLQSLPIWLISMATLALAARLAACGEMGRTNRHASLHAGFAFRGLPIPGGRVLWRGLGGVILLASLLPGLGGLISWVIPKHDEALRTYMTPLLGAVRLALPQFGASLVYAAGSALFASIFGVAIWRAMRVVASRRGGTAIADGKVAWLVEWILATPFVLSGLFLGILLIGASQAAGAWAWWQGTWLMGLAALAVRFVWIPFKAASVAHAQIQSDLLDAAKVFRLSSAATFKAVEWPAMKPSLATAAWMVYVLALWDVETLVLIYPAGGEPVSLRLFQLLHYGYDAQVGVLSLGLVAMGLLPGLALGFIRYAGFHRPSPQGHKMIAKR
ncbi:MAG: iron ABC transporter permease [Verrucomicrobia bacterium]|nr:iron ABC transporter permease [Verrucomicrobiota bacterium]